MRSSILALLGLAAVTFAVPTSLSPQRISFEDYVVQFNKQYDTREFQVRKSIFEANLEKIEAHNAKGTSSHTKGVNKFTDWTEQEMKRMFGFDKSLSVHRRIQRLGQHFFRSSVTPRLTNTSNLPTSVDWTTKGVLTHVKNQGGCGSCWAFAGTEAIEANIAIETGRLLTLAPQQFVDCVVNSDQCGGSGGCEGATPDLLFAYAQSHGVFNETQYPYKGEDMTCKNLTDPVATITGWSDVLTNDYDGLMEAVVKQPVTVGVAASNWGYYSGGVLSFSECDADIDHAVLLVGYGTDPQLGDYWKIQNSWGPDWGEKGFIRLARSASDNKNCKQDKNPADGFACKDGPKEVTVCGTCGILYLPSYPTGGHVIN